jgi:hypothetical protein
MYQLNISKREILELANGNSISNTYQNICNKLAENMFEDWKSDWVEGEVVDGEGYYQTDIELSFENDNTRTLTFEINVNIEEGTGLFTALNHERKYNDVEVEIDDMWSGLQEGLYQLVEQIGGQEGERLTEKAFKAGETLAKAPKGVKVVEVSDGFLIIINVRKTNVLDLEAWKQNLAGRKIEMNIYSKLSPDEQEIVKNVVEKSGGTFMTLLTNYSVWKIS